VTTAVANVIREASRLESLAMGIYTRLAATFRTDPDLHRFWMSMARHEAGHVGALALIQALLEQAGDQLRFEVEDSVVREAGAVIEGLHAEAATPVSVDRAFEIAVELESLELEDLVLDLIHILSDPAARSQAEQMLLHDLSDLSLMIEKHCKSEDLLSRADILVENRVGDRPSGGYVRRC
jgi:rubrerythrin